MEFDKKISALEDVIGNFEISVQEQLNLYLEDKDDWIRTYEKWGHYKENKTIIYQNLLKKSRSR